LIAGHYRLLERIGSGAMGVVWRARDERLERIVAIKQLLLQPGLSQQQREEARKRAMREARIAARLHHPNAIVVFDVAEHEGDPCLVMEYMLSRSLAAVLTERGSLPVSAVAAMGSQIASALAAAHASGIVHRDVKPGNVLINDEGIAKITDFGIARAAGDMTLTQTGTFAGTPAYLAPEVARGQDPTQSSDVFSLGATLYDAVEGGPPFPDRTNQLALLHMVAEGRIQPPKQAGELTSLLLKLLQVEPSQRPSMTQSSSMLGELARARAPRSALLSTMGRPTLPDLVRVADDPRPAGAAPAPAAGQPPTPPAPPPTAAMPPAGMRPAPPPPSGQPANRDRRNRRVLITVIVLVVVVVGGLVGWLIASSGGSPQAGGGQPSTGTSAPSTAPSSAPSSSSTSNGPSSGTIQLTDAGNLVVDFYGTKLTSTPAAAWALLTAHGQSYYGNDENTFASYWRQYSSVYGQVARGSYNPDGSVNMSYNVTVMSGTSQVVRSVTVRVVAQGGQLLIDSDTHYPA
jgi:serine/threonine protein kinase